MKKLLLTTILLFLPGMSLPASAQEAIGFYAGFNVTNLARNPGDINSTHNQATRFSFGALVDFKILSDFTLRLEPIFVRKGAIFDFTDPADETNSRQNLTKDYNYFEVPVLLKYNFLSKTEPFFLLAGASFAIPVSLEHNTRRGSTDVSDQISGFDYGATVGAGKKLKANKAVFFIEGRFNLGLKNINASDDTSFTLKNNGFRLLFGLIFPFGE